MNRRKKPRKQKPYYKREFIDALHVAKWEE
jgi:hypothetical protein